MVDASTIGVIQALYGTGANGGIPTPLVTDKTLALENRAADAKAAGDAFRARECVIWQCVRRVDYCDGFFRRAFCRTACLRQKHAGRHAAPDCARADYQRG